MNEPKILILNPNKAGDAGEKMRLLLTASLTPEARIDCQQINLGADRKGAHGALETVNGFGPDIILLDLSAVALGKARALLPRSERPRRRFP